MPTELYLSHPLAFLILKATALLVAAAVASFLLRRRSAALRHLMWAGCAVGLLLLPVYSIVLPAWTVTVPALQVGAAPSIAPDSERVASRDSEADRESARTPDFGPHATSGAAAEVPEPGVASVIGPEPDAGTPALQEADASAATPPGGVRWAWFWAGGTVFFLLIRLAGDARICCIGRRHRPLGAGGSAERLREAFLRNAGILGLRKSPGLLIAPGSTLPFAGGIWRPFIVVPESALGWDDEKLRSVLLHELAHVERRDCLTQWIGHCARALFWFHPLAWWMTYRMRVEREQACDDRVLEAGQSPSRYARVLLDLVQEADASGRVPYGALAMARRSTFEGRLVALLDARRERRGLNRRMVAAAFGVVAGATLPLAMVHAAGAEFEGEEPASGEPATAPRAVARLDNDIEVEIIDVGNRLADPVEWWAPDGGEVGEAGQEEQEAHRLEGVNDGSRYEEVRSEPSESVESGIEEGDVGSVSLEFSLESVDAESGEITILAAPRVITAPGRSAHISVGSAGAGRGEESVYRFEVGVLPDMVNDRVRVAGEVNVYRPALSSAEDSSSGVAYSTTSLNLILEPGEKTPVSGMTQRSTRTTTEGVYSWSEEIRLYVTATTITREETARRSREMAEQRMATAGERLREARERYEAGEADSLELYDAETALTEARIALEHSQADAADGRQLDRRYAERMLELAERRLEQVRTLQNAGRVEVRDVIEAELRLMEAWVQLARIDADDTEIRELERITLERRTELAEQMLARMRVLQEIGRATEMEVRDAELELMENQTRLARIGGEEDELRRLAQRRVDLMERQLEEIRAQQNIGRADSSEVIQAEIALMEARMALRELED